MMAHLGEDVLNSNALLKTEADLSNYNDTE